jgi:hypothetical protein
VPDRDKERYKLYVRTASDPVIEADRVVKTFIYTPSSKYLERMQALLEQRTDTKREREVMIKQARAALKIQTLPKKGDFPMLDAEVGVTINGNTGQPVTDPVEAAQMILAEEDQTDEDLAAEREFRLSVLKQINEAATDAEKIQIFEDNIG